MNQTSELLSQKREEFRIRIRRDSIEKDFNQRRWKNLDINGNDFKELAHLIETSPDNHTRYIVDNHIAKELMTFIIDHKEDHEKTLDVFKVMLRMAEANIELRSELTKVKFVDSLPAYLATQNVGLNIILDICYHLVVDKNRVPKPHTENLITSLNIIAKSGQLTKSTTESLLKVLKEYIRGSSAHITQVINKKRILELIFNNLSQEVYAYNVLEKLTQGNSKQVTQLLSFRPSLLFDLLNLLKTRTSRIMKEKIYQIFQNFIDHDDVPLITKNLYEDGIIKNLLQIATQETHNQVMCQILSTCEGIMYCPTIYISEILEVVPITMKGLMNFSCRRIVQQSLQNIHGYLKYMNPDRIEKKGQIEMETEDILLSAFRFQQLPQHLDNLLTHMDDNISQLAQEILDLLNDN